MKHQKRINTNFARYIPLAIGVFVAVAAFGYATSGTAGVKTAVGSDVKSKELRALTIESWDRDYTGRGIGWEVHTNKDTSYRIIKKEDYKDDLTNPQAERAVKLVRGSPQDIKENLGFDKAYVLGIKFAFTFPGNNVVTIRPPRGVDQYIVERPRPYLNENILLKPGTKPRSCFSDPSMSQNSKRAARGQIVDCVHGIEMPGSVKAISVWVNGRGNEYDLEGWIEDWKGDTHILKFGSLDFVGWRPLMAKIPRNIPQDVNSFPQIKTLVFKQFKIRSRPNTSQEPVYLFMDELRILTDIFEVHFDGAQIDFDKADCVQKQRLYEVIRRAARYPDRFTQPKDCSKAPGPPQPLPGDSNKGGDKKGGGGGKKQGG